LSSIAELIEERSQLSDAAIDQLQAIVSDWQILADLAFADLLLVCRDDASGGLFVVAQMRPYTAQTVYDEDLVGCPLSADDRPGVERAFDEARIQRDGRADFSRGIPVREESIPIVFDGEVIAVVTRESNLGMVRSPSQLELAYLQTADELSVMLAEGSFPFPGEDPERELAPRVGDGMLRMDPDGNVVYASPNAISAYRRLGVADPVIGRNVRAFDLDVAAVLEALADGEPLESEVEARGAVVLRRLLPLTHGPEVLGGLMLVREVTELRRHERLLLYKDATIREIHHRVKNNLQTVASLLRLQSRRLSSEESRQALGESVRRISSIALVHETLSQDSRQRVSFDKVTARLADMLTTGLTDPDCPVQVTLEGEAGELPAEVATPLALVLSELVQNAVEHAFPGTSGTITVQLERGPATLELLVLDDGVGVPEGWEMEICANLGLRIASTLVESELNGTLMVSRRPAGGTACAVKLPLPR
jgi:two-component sensor histidine kinase